MRGRRASRGSRGAAVLALAAALGLGGLTPLVSPDSARADHVCQVNPAASYGVH